MLKMIKGRIKHSGLLQADVTADVNSQSVDLQDFNSLALLFSIGAFTPSGTDKAVLKVEHSDDNITFVACDASDLDTSESANIVKTIDTGSEDDQMYEVHYKGNKRYVRGAIDVSGTVDFAASVVGVLGYPELMPPL